MCDDVAWAQLFIATFNSVTKTRQGQLIKFFSSLSWNLIKFILQFPDKTERLTPTLFLLFTFTF